MERTAGGSFTTSSEKGSSEDGLSLWNTTSPSDDQMSSSSNPVQTMERQALSEPICSACTQLISDRYLLKASNELWHESCLVCAYCGEQLGAHPSCFLRDGKIFCKADYFRLYSMKCHGCMTPISPEDMVFRCGDFVYHAGCFSCMFCGAILKKGDHYVFHDGHLICRADYEMICASRAPPGIDNGHHGGKKYGSHSDKNSKNPKRPRTILSSVQRKAFKEAFNISAKPCRKVRENLAKETGLSVRVVQVWFQNQRAKMKKIERKHGDGTAGEGSGDGAFDSDGDKNSGLSDDEDEIKSIVLGGEDEKKDGGSLDCFYLKDRKTSSASSSSVTNALGECGVYSSASSFPSGMPPASSGSPIDQLYSMQTAYFSY